MSCGPLTAIELFKTIPILRDKRKPLRLSASLPERAMSGWQNRITLFAPVSLPLVTGASFCLIRA